MSPTPSPPFFKFNYFSGRVSYFLCPDPPTYSLPCSWDCKYVPSHPIDLLRWGLTSILPGLTSNLPISTSWGAGIIGLSHHAQILAIFDRGMTAMARGRETLFRGIRKVSNEKPKQGIWQSWYIRAETQAAAAGSCSLQREFICVRAVVVGCGEAWWTQGRKLQIQILFCTVQPETSYLISPRFVFPSANGINIT
jgi:hypothetical protein